MKKDCECQYCKNNVNEYFCLACGHNFNECETLFEYRDPILDLPNTLCPKCYDEKWKPSNSYQKDNVFLRNITLT